MPRLLLSLAARGASRATTTAIKGFVLARLDPAIRPELDALAADATCGQETT